MQLLKLNFLCMYVVPLKYGTLLFNVMEFSFFRILSERSLTPMK